MTMDDICVNLNYEPSESAGSSKKGKKKKSGKRKPKSPDAEASTIPRKVRKKSADTGDSTDDEGRERRRHDDMRAPRGGIISSLFGRNPEIPSVEFHDVEAVTEPVFSKENFKDLEGVHPYMVSNLEQNFNVTQLTTVQKLSIPQLLAGKDALVRSQTGSGKTLAYAIPILQSLQGVRPKLTRDSGIRALVILPTRELALQTYECFLKLVKSYTWIVPGLLAGGEKKKSEKARLRKGINILVGTPGRVLDHALTTKVLSFHLVSWLILDEGDKLLEMGYEKDISRLVEIVEKHRDDYSSMLTLPRRQTVLLSATLTSAVERLAGLALDDPVHIDASTGEETDDFFVIPDSLTQKYVVVAPKLRLVVLASFIIRKCEVDAGSKMLVFMATQDMVDYHTNLLSTVLPKTADFYKLHGNMLQAERVEVFKSFRNSSSGVLLCTDVAARGLDLPKVDWIVQFTAPCNAADYVHRVGRTARVGTTGSALLFLAPSEVPFLEQLNCKRIKLNEENVSYCLDSLLLVDFESQNQNKFQKKRNVEDAATELQLNFEQAVLDQTKLHDLACKAYQSWVRFYASYPKESRGSFNFQSLHLGHYAKSFALRDAPSKISGIGRPKNPKQIKHKRKRNELSMDGAMSRTRSLVVSEFDSGLKPLPKAH